MLGAHYRSPISFSPENLSQAQNGAQRLRNCWYDLANTAVVPEEKDEGRDERIRALESARERFDESLCDDFNTAAALGHLYEAVRTINQAIAENRAVNERFHRTATDFLKYADEILGIIDAAAEPAAAAGLDEEEIRTLVNERKEARKNRDFTRADDIREKLASMGIILEDTPEGTRWKRSL
jgi:cysteinyl-tRNA synthetase